MNCESEDQKLSTAKLTNAMIESSRDGDSTAESRRRFMNRRWVLLLLAVTQLGVDAVLISQFPPAGRDFVIQLTAGRVSVLDGPEKVYDRETQTARQAEILGIDEDEVRLLPFNHPPLLLPVLGPLSRSSPRSAYFLWTAVSLALFISGIALLT
jgi:hypothetical protein